jgi:signal transduction histidine kinase
MTADRLLQWLTQLLFVVCFLAVLPRAIRSPRRAHVDTALFFGVLALIVAEQWLFALLGAQPPPLVGALVGILLMALPYLMLRLLDDFADVPTWVKRAAEVGLALATVGLIAVPPPLPPVVVLAYVAYFVALQVYTSVAFLRVGRRSSGVTRRRLQTVAAGSALLGGVLVIAGLQVLAPGLADIWLVLSRLTGLASGLAYFLGFAPPAVLRRAWQEPELREFLGRAASLPRLPTTSQIVHELERGTASALGVSAAALGLWDDDDAVIRFTVAGPTSEVRPGELTVGRAFAEQRAIFTTDARRAFPEHAEQYARNNVRAVMAAPITAGGRRLGVLTAYASRAPIFADDDLRLLQLLADQASVVLESRALIDEASRVRAREEMTRLKDDFLSSAAHDLKTPLTTLVAQAQLLERRTRLKPEQPADLEGIRRMVAEATRLRALVLELLDASRVEHGRLVGGREPLDLVGLARQACERHNGPRHQCRVEGHDRLVGDFDRARVEQLIENLVDNAVKYSPEGGDVVLRLSREGEEARMSVTDQGIGIPSEDLPRLFERFHRGGNVDDRRFAGMGLGLYICRGIVQEHGGRIWASSRIGQGSTFHVALPLHAATPAASEAAGAVRG